MSKPFYRPPFGEGLEKIIFTEEQESPRDVLDRLVTDKTRALRVTARALLDEIKLSEDLDIHLINSINQRIAYLTTSLNALEIINPNYLIEPHDTITKQMHFRNPRDFRTDFY